jgi:hypothetical protein
LRLLENFRKKNNTKMSDNNLLAKKKEIQFTLFTHKNTQSEMMSGLGLRGAP